jgi:hypothetical protein
MDNNEKIKPCEIPCPKCGYSGEIKRKYYARNSEINKHGLNNKFYSKYIEKKYDGWYHCNEEIIFNTCGCCGYQWATKL